MATFVHPSLDPDSWNGITIDGTRSPGTVELPKFASQRKIDEKPSPGSNTFALTDKGRECEDVEVVFVLWTNEHFQQFEKLHADALSPERKLEKRNIVTVVHPSLYLAGIRRGYFYSVGSIQGKPGGPYRIAAKFKHFSDKMQIGGGQGSTKPKLKPDYKGLGGKWTKEALDRSKSAEEVGTTVGAAPKASTQKAAALTQAQLNKSAAAGNSNARLTKGIQDKQAQDW